MNLTLTIDPADTLLARGINPASDWVARARSFAETFTATVSSFGDRALFETLRGVIPNLSLRPYSSGVDVLSGRLLIGSITQTVTVPKQRTADDAMGLADAVGRNHQPAYPSNVRFLGVGRRA